MKIKITLIFIIILAFVFRIYKLDIQGIWLDEKDSVCCATGSPYGYYKCNGIATWHDFTLDNKYDSIFNCSNFKDFNTIKNTYNSSIKSNGSIVYFSILHFWIQVFGPSDYSIRFLSVFFGIITVLLSFHVCFLLFQSSRIALISSFLIAIHPLLIDSSQFARSGALTTFISLLATFFLIKIITESNKKSNYIGYFISLSTALLSHYLVIYIFIAHGFFMILFIRKKSIWRNYILTIIGAFVVFALWLYLGGLDGLSFLSKVNANFTTMINNQDVSMDSSLYFSKASFKNIFIALVQNVSTIFGNYSQIVYFNVKVLILFLTIPATFLLIYFFKRHIDKEFKTDLYIFLLILVCSSIFFTLLMAIISNHMISFNIIYSQYSVPYAMFMLSFGINEVLNFSKKHQVILYIFIVLHVSLMLTSVVNYHLNKTKRIFNPYNTISKIIEESYEPNDLVVFPSWEDALLTNLYFQENKNIFQKVDTTLINEVKLINTQTNKSLKIIDLRDIRY